MKQKKVDLYLLLPVMFLLLLGIIMVLSSSAIFALDKTNYSDPYYFFKRHFLRSLLGMVAMYIGYAIPYKSYQKKNRLFMLIIIGVLVTVLIPGIGHEENGARSWLVFGQPSEMVKLLLVLVLASVMVKKIKKIDTFEEGVLPPLLLIGITCLLVFLQNDMGTALIIASTGLVMLFAAGSNIRYFVGIGSAFVGLAVFGVLFARFRLRRILVFLNPWQDPQHYGYQTVQSLYALGSGGLFGLGLGQGRQKYLYIPEQHTDFIYSIIGEELGFLGAAFVLLMFLVIAARGYKIARFAPDTFGSLIAVGITSMIVIEALINIGVVTNTIPVTGVTLPFLSYGGTSIIFKMAGVGILMNISGSIRWRHATD